MVSVAQEVETLARQSGIILGQDYASWLADQVSRISGFEGDATLKLIGTLMEAGILTDEEGVDLVLRHHRETDWESRGCR